MERRPGRDRLHLRRRGQHLLLGHQGPWVATPAAATRAWRDPAGPTGTRASRPRTAPRTGHSNNTTRTPTRYRGHGAVPSITGQAHDGAMRGGAPACHNPPAATHQNGAFTGNDTVAGDSTNMGLGAFYTTSGVDNAHTCANTGAGCHGGGDLPGSPGPRVGTPTAGYYTTNTTACAGCHGDWANGRNAGTIHRTSVGTQSKHGTGTTWDCRDCHVLEATTNNYTFAFGTTDGSRSTRRASTATPRSRSTTTVWRTPRPRYFAARATRRRTTCTTSSSWPIAGIGGDAVTVSCGECHTAG